MRKITLAAGTIFIATFLSAFAGTCPDLSKGGGLPNGYSTIAGDPTLPSIFGQATWSHNSIIVRDKIVCLYQNRNGILSINGPVVKPIEDNQSLWVGTSTEKTCTTDNVTYCPFFP